MNDKVSFARIWLDVALFGVIGSGLGMMIGVFLAGQSQTVNGFVDPTPYQDFAVFAGAGIGIAVTLLALVCYLFLTRRLLHQAIFRSGVLLLFSGVGGAVVTVATFCIVGASAARYGIIPRTGGIVVFDGVVCALFGGGTGTLTGAILTRVRGYDE